KVEAGKMELDTVEFSPRELVTQVDAVLRHQADKKGLELHVGVSPRVPEVLIGDPVRLNQILLNLAGNAVKFTDKGSVGIEVMPAAGGPTAQMEFSVSDTGIGIAEDKLA